MSHPLLSPRPMCPLCHEKMQTWTTDKEYVCKNNGCKLEDKVLTVKEHSELWLRINPDLEKLRTQLEALINEADSKIASSGFNASYDCGRQDAYKHILHIISL